MTFLISESQTFQQVWPTRLSAIYEISALIIKGICVVKHKDICLHVRITHNISLHDCHMVALVIWVRRIGIRPKEYRVFRVENL